ncbi:MAG: oxidoreductase [Acidimicrobiales bacterium]|nr:oxidoreductase [Acidimicrobiales bacterium]
MDSFEAFLVGKIDDQWTRRVEQITVDDLPAGDVLIEVEYSGINYKDGLASSEAGRVARVDPLIPGIDLAGTVVADGGGFSAGDKVIAHGYDIGVAHHGGYARYARVPAGWVVPMPEGLDSMQAMLVGTAGYTAALSVEALENHGLRAGDGPVLVTGATGGVGSMAVGMLAKRGYEIVASTGKADKADWLKALGASEVIDRSETSAESKRPLESERWAGCVDCVGGTTLEFALRTARYGSTVAASGLTGGPGLSTTVMPFILRGVTLAGIDSVNNPIDQRIAVWKRIATDMRPTQLDEGDAPTVVGFADLPAELDRILAGGMVGRTLVSPTS